MPWYAIRSVYRFGVKSDGTGVFEERVVVFRADSWDEAHRRGKEESEVYARDNGFDAHPERSGYEQDGDALIDRYEVWSELFESRATLEGFYAERYGRYVYRSEEP